jgi:hypothetical protein
MVDQGDLVRFGNYSAAPGAAPFTNLAGTPTDPTAVTLTVARPGAPNLVYGWPSAGADGTLTKESAGRFYFDVVIDRAGTWLYLLVGTGAVTAASEGELVVTARRITV